MGYYEDLNNGKVGKSSDAHYISAYGIAVKHGFTGSEEEWLESLSDYGIAKKHGFTGSEEEWNEAVNAAREAAEAAKTAAETAQKGAEAAQAGAYSDAEYVGNALTYILEIQSSIDGAKSTVASARKEAVSARDDAKAAQKGAETAQKGAEAAKTAAETAQKGAEAAKTAAEAARDEAEAVKSDVENIAGELSDYVKVSGVFESEPFAWTDFEYFADGARGFIGTVGEESVIIDRAEDGEFVQIVCRDNILGFTCSVEGIGRLKINGENRLFENETFTVPPTYLTKDLFFYGDESTWTFTDMVKYGVRGVSELEGQIGDIDTALDEIIAIADALIEGDG